MALKAAFASVRWARRLAPPLVADLGTEADGPGPQAAGGGACGAVCCADAWKRFAQSLAHPEYRHNDLLWRLERAEVIRILDGAIITKGRQQWSTDR